MSLRVAAVFLVTLMAGCASPAPTPSPSPTPTAEPSPSPEPALRVDGLATVFQADLRLWADPTDRRGRQKDYVQLEAGTRVLLVDGPREVDGTDYWQLYPSTMDYTVPLGWAAATDGAGVANLAPFQPVCPPAEGTDAAALAALSQLELVSCYGNRELMFRGLVTCNFGIADDILAGPMRNSNIWCGIDAAIGLTGPVITGLQPRPVTTSTWTGNYVVRGHFDDPGAQHCYGTSFGTSLGGSRDPGDPGAIQACRAFFVVTRAEPLEGKNSVTPQ
jgi:hypothetical protein